MTRDNMLLLSNYTGGTMMLIWLGMSFGLIIPNATVLLVVIILQLLITFKLINTADAVVGYSLGALIVVIRILEFALIVVAISGHLFMWQYLIGFYILLGAYMMLKRPDLFNKIHKGIK